MRFWEFGVQIKKSIEFNKGTLGNTSVTKWREDLKTRLRAKPLLVFFVCSVGCSPDITQALLAKWTLELRYRWCLSISVLNPYQKTTVHRVSKCRVCANAANLSTLLQNRTVLFKLPVEKSFWLTLIMISHRVGRSLLPSQNPAIFWSSYSVIRKIIYQSLPLCLATFFNSLNAAQVAELPLEYSMREPFNVNLDVYRVDIRRVLLLREDLDSSLTDGIGHWIQQVVEQTCGEVKTR